MPARYPDSLRQEAIDIYRETGTTGAVVERLDVSRAWAWRVCDEAGVIEKTEYPEALKERAQELIDDGCTQREAAQKLQAETGGDGPSYQWVNTHTDVPEGRSTYRRRPRRTFEYNGREIVLCGTHSIETCRAALEDYDEGGRPGEICERYGVPRSTLEKLTDRAGIMRSPKEARINRIVANGEVSPIARRRTVERLYTEEKLSVTQIATRLEEPQSKIYDDLQARDVELRSRSHAMILRFWGSLKEYRTFCQKVAIMVHHRGETKKAACERFDVSRTTINRALAHWNHLKSGDEDDSYWTGELRPTSRNRSGLSVSSAPKPNR